MSKTTIDVDTRTFVRFWLVLLGIGLIILFLYKAATGLIIIGVSIFLALALRPLVNHLSIFFTKRSRIGRTHKTLSAVLAYSIVFLTFIVIIVVVGPVIVDETAKFIADFPRLFENTIGGWDGINRFGESIGVSDLSGEISKALSNFSNNIVNNLGSTVMTVGDSLAKGGLTIILTLLFMLEGPGIMERFWKNLSARKEDQKSVSVYRRIVSRMSTVVSTYVSHQVIVALIDGLSATIIVFVLSLIFQFSPGLAIPMGLVAFIFYLIPMFGQFIGGAIISFVLLCSSPIAAAVFIVVYILYAQVENNFIAPKIQGDALRLNIVVVLSALVIGMYMFGLIGAIIAIPVAGCIRILIEEYPKLKALHE